MFEIKSQKELTKDDKRIKILFVDEKNSLQSQIAEYFLNEIYGKNYASYSAGPKFDFIDCELISAMYQNGYDIRTSRSKDFRSKQLPMKFDYIVFLEKATYDRVGTVVPYDSKNIVEDFGNRSDLKATDDKELFDAYTKLIENVRVWVKDMFSNEEKLKEKVL